MNTAELVCTLRVFLVFYISLKIDLRECNRFHDGICRESKPDLELKISVNIDPQ